MMRLMLPTLLGTVLLGASCSKVCGQDSPAGASGKVSDVRATAGNPGNELAADAAKSALAAAAKNTATKQSDGASIDYWVSQLGHDHYLRREKATEKLVAAGTDAIPALVQVIRVGDLEVIERATEVLTEIAFSRPPAEDGGSWAQLQQLATQAVGRRASCAKIAVEEIREHRADQAREALSAAGIFVGMDEFAISAITIPAFDRSDRWCMERRCQIAAMVGMVERCGVRAD